MPPPSAVLHPDSPCPGIERGILVHTEEMSLESGGILWICFSALLWGFTGGLMGSNGI